MRRKTCVLFISLNMLLPGFLIAQQDTVKFTRSIAASIDLSGPVIYSIDKKMMSFEGALSYHINPKYYIVAEPGYSRYNYSQYNYTQNTEGMFLRLGIDQNLMKTGTAGNNHFAGVGIRYGIALFNQETPWYSYNNYWGHNESAIVKKFVHAHFFEINGGVKAEVFRNITIGWIIRLSLPLINSAGKDNNPGYIPGIGSVKHGFNPGFSYHLTWVIPVGD